MPNTKRILVVDDSPLSRSFHCYIIRQAGFDVEAAADGAEGLRALSRARFDAVLTDLEMAGMDGVEFTRRIRELSGHGSTPVVVLSCHDRNGDKESAFSAGANLYLVKPATRELIVDSLRLIVGARKG